MWSESVPVGIPGGEQTIIRLGKQRTSAVVRPSPEVPRPVHHSSFRATTAAPAWDSADSCHVVLDEESAVTSPSAGAPPLTPPPTLRRGVWETFQSEIREQYRFVRDEGPSDDRVEGRAAVAKPDRDSAGSCDLETFVGDGGVDESCLDPQSILFTREVQEVTPRPREREGTSGEEDRENAKSIDEEEPKAILIAVLPEAVVEDVDFFAAAPVEPFEEVATQTLPRTELDSPATATPFTVGTFGCISYESSFIKCPWYRGEAETLALEAELDKDAFHTAEDIPTLPNSERAELQSAIPIVEFFHRDLTETRKLARSTAMLAMETKTAATRLHIATCSELEIQHFEAEARLWSDKLRSGTSDADRQKTERPTSPPARKLTHWQTLCEAALGSTPPPLSTSRTPREAQLNESACRVRNTNDYIADEWKESEGRSKEQSSPLQPGSPSTARPVHEDPKVTLAWFNNKLEQALLGGVGSTRVELTSADPPVAASDGLGRPEGNLKRTMGKPLLSPLTADLDQRPYLSHRAGELAPSQPRYPFTAAPTNPFNPFGSKPSTAGNRWNLNDPSAVQGKFFSDRASPPRLRGKPLLPPSFD